MSVADTNVLRRICTIIEANVYGTAYFKYREETDEHIPNKIYKSYEIHIDTDFMDWYSKRLITAEELPTLSQKDEHNIIEEILKEYKEDTYNIFFKYKGKENSDG